MKKKWNPLIRASGGPKYIALVEALETGIEKGELRAGDRLPSHRELGDLFGVTIATVTKAMSEAARRGIIEARVGSGTFIRERSIETAAPDAIIDLSINTPPTEVVATLLAEAVAKIPSKQLAHDLFNYSSYAMSSQHRQLSAAWVSQFCSTARPDNLLITNGVHQGLLAAFGALLGAGESAICEQLTYTGIKRIAEYRGVKLIGANCDEEGLTPDSLESSLRQSGAKIVIITTTTQNPTTGTLSEKRRQALAEVCRKADAWIIEDGVNMPLANDGLPAIADIAPERTIHLTGFSKCVASGFRLGYAVLPERIFSAFRDALVSTQWTGPGVYSELAATMLANGVMEQCIARQREEAVARFALAQQALGGLRKSALPSYHAWVTVPAGWSAEEFSARASQMGVRISPASHFAISLADLPAAYRISLGACASRAQLEEGLARLASIGSAPTLAHGTVI